MAQQIIFFEKNACDYSDPNVSTTASQADDVADRVLNRNNTSAWMTTGSVDADNTTLEIDMVDEHDITDIILIKHNFKAYTVQYWNGSAYADFSTAISETDNADETTYHQFTQVTTTKLKLTVLGTIVANSDKRLFQFIATKRIGQLTAWPIIDNPVHTKNKKITTMLSGKVNITENVGRFSVDLAVKNWRTDADLDVVETLFESGRPFLVWLCGGDETQFFSKRIGYRLEDIYLMRCQNDYEPQYYKGLYQAGIDLKLKLVEVVR